MRVFGLALAATLLAGCVNPYAKFYRGPPDARMNPAWVNEPGPIRIYQAKGTDEDVTEMFRRGYRLVGTSSFSTSNQVSESQLLEQATKIGAHVVLVKSKVTGSHSAMMPLTLPTSSTTVSTGQATAFGPGGTVTAYGSGTSTTYGTQTTYIPYTVTNSDHFAAYFAKVKMRLGLLTKDTTDDLKRRLQMNGGAVVTAVAMNTPAFDANVLPGDVLIQIAGQPVRSAATWTEALSPLGAVAIDLVLDRDGTRISKTLTLLPP